MPYPQWKEVINFKHTSYEDSACIFIIIQTCMLFYNMVKSGYYTLKTLSNLL